MTVSYTFLYGFTQWMEDSRGLSAAQAGLLLLLSHPSAIWLLVAVTLVFGIPQGLNSLANQNAVYYQADPARLGSSSGLLRTFTYLGAMIASAP